MSEQNKAIVARWTDELWNRGDFSAAHEFVTADVQYRGNQMPPADGLKALQDTVLEVRAGFPDGQFSIDELVAEGQSGGPAHGVAARHSSHARG